VCNECGSIIDLPDRLFDGLARAVDRAYDFSLQTHHAALLGHCSRCR
jgi:Fe2+ or Zn2+ uptake regulation protein